MVYFTKGKSKKWITRKMKIGGALLALTALTTCNGGGENVVTCYVQPEPNSIWILEVKGDSITVDLDTGRVLNGQISMREAGEFSFAIKNSSYQKIQVGEISASDGTFDEKNEEFQIKLNENIESGNYTLGLFDVKTDMQDSIMRIREFKLNIKNE